MVVPLSCDVLSAISKYPRLHSALAYKNIWCFLSHVNNDDSGTYLKPYVAKEIWAKHICAPPKQDSAVGNNQSRQIIFSVLTLPSLYNVRLMTSSPSLGCTTIVPSMR